MLEPSAGVRTVPNTSLLECAERPDWLCRRGTGHPLAWNTGMGPADRQPLSD